MIEIKIKIQKIHYNNCNTTKLSLAFFSLTDLLLTSLSDDITQFLLFVYHTSLLFLFCSCPVPNLLLSGMNNISDTIDSLIPAMETLDRTH